MTKAQDKTNVMRILDQKKAEYKSYYYETDGTLTGAEIAEMLGLPKERVFKTLVCSGKTNNKYVFVIPVEEELDLKKAAKSVGEKSMEMLKSKDLLPTTGYVHGGCSPIGMKKFFTTTVHITAESMDTIFFSAGRIGAQVEMSPKDLERVIRLKYDDVTVS